MKTFSAGILLLTLLASCKKDYTISCEKTMADIAGSYKITKYETVSSSTGQATDYTYTLTPCELSGIYDLDINNTATYTEPVTCTGNATGTWNVGSNLVYEPIFSISFTSGNANRLNSTFIIEKWDCTNLALMTMYPGPAYQGRYTLTRIGY